jgi:hypothetical protein
MTRIIISLCDRITSARLIFAKCLIPHWKYEIKVFHLVDTIVFNIFIVNGYLKFKLVQGTFVVLAVLQLELQVAVDDKFLETFFLLDMKGLFI